MGETNNKTEREFWTKHSAEIAIEMSRKMQAISDILSNNALSADSGTYVKLRNLEPNVKELFYILTTI